MQRDSQSTPETSYFAPHSDNPMQRAFTSLPSDRPSVTSSRAQKLNQLVQNFYAKAAQIVIQARQPVAPLYSRGSTTKRLNKWFNIELDETDAFREELRLWRTADVSEPEANLIPPALIVDVVLSTRDLTPNQTLILLDDNGTRWDVEHGGIRRRLPYAEIVLERWSIDLRCPPVKEPPELPVAYKKSIVVFRSLYALTRLLPAWRLRKRLAKSKLTGNALRVVCRIDTGNSPGRIDVNQSLVSGRTSKVESHSFYEVETPAGNFNIKVDYRKDCDFRVDDSEALLSSQFINSDEGNFRPQVRSKEPATGSLPADTGGLRGYDRPYYGSLSSFHQSSSNLNDTTRSSYASQDRKDRNSLRSTEQQVITRKPSGAFIQPFKTPSLSDSPSLDPSGASPRPGTAFRTPSSASLERQSARPAFPLTQRTEMPPPLSVPTSGSPRLLAGMAPPIRRYSSSFGQRTGSFQSRRRTSQLSDSFQNQDDSRSSRNSSRSPSTLLVQVDQEEEDLGEYVKMLEFRKPLKGIEALKDTKFSIHESMVVRTNAALTKYQQLRESHAVLGDSLCQSMVLRSSTIPPVTLSRRVSNAPGLTSGTSLYSASSSPGKPISPHTPAIPSRLSESSVMPRPASSHQPDAVLDLRAENDNQRGQAATDSVPLDIPASPMPPLCQRRSYSCVDRSLGFEETVQADRTSLSLGSIELQYSKGKGFEKDGVLRKDSSTAFISANSSSSYLQNLGLGARNRSAVTGKSLSNSAAGGAIRRPSSSSLRDLPLSGVSDPANRRANAPEDDDLLFAMSDIRWRGDSRLS